MADLIVLHTSDWHLGHQLYKTRRDEQFAAFLNWLIAIIDEYKIDILIVAGDIFDTAAPNAATQKLYYDFLGKAARSHCRHIVLTAGNHDSPAFLTAPGQLLQSLDIIVVGSARDPEEEVFGLRDQAGQLELVLCAVPYLRERDVRISTPGETAEEKSQSLLNGIAAHYEAVAQKARQMLEAEGKSAPVLATGHLYAVGGLADQNGEHELYAGSLAAVAVDTFPEIFDYVAMGHLHRPQIIGENETRRYSGSPLPMSFQESRQNKSVSLVKFSGGTVRVETLNVPEMQRFATIHGSREHILAKLEQLAAAETDSIWVEIIHDGTDPAGDLNSACRELAEGTNVRILCVKAHHPGAAMSPQQSLRRLEDFSVEDVFKMKLERTSLAPEEQAAMLPVFQELLQLYYESKREI